MTSYQSTLLLSRSNLKLQLISNPSLGTCLLWSPCDKYLFVSEGSHILQFEANNGGMLNKLRGFTDAEVICLLMHPLNSQQIFSASLDGVISIWDLQDLVLLHTIDLSRKTKYITFVNLNCYILFASGDVFCLPAKSLTRSGQDKLEKYLGIKEPLITSPLSNEIATFSTNENEWLITSSEKTLILYSTQNQELKNYKQKYVITRISVHPSKAVLSFGDNRGRIFLWHEFTRGDITLTRIHWHSHSVHALSFTGDGSYLLSGGEEGVLVVWQLETLKKQFRPRLGCGICHLKSSNSDDKIAICSEDNSIKVLHSSNLELSFISQNLKRSNWPRFLVPCEVLDSLILHSSPGWLQFYKPNTCQRLFDIDVTELNLVSRPDNVPLSYSLITHVATSLYGHWMMTSEAREDVRDAFSETRIRFWNFSPEEKTYHQTTCVDMPHDKLLDMNFSLHSHELPIAVTSGQEGNFRIWKLKEAKRSPGKQIRLRWYCEAVGSHDNTSATQAKFSADGSLLGVSFRGCVTLWSVETMELKENLYSIHFKEYLSSLEFGYKDNSHYVIGGSSYHIIVWDLLSCDVIWTAFLQNPRLFTHPDSHLFAVTSYEGNKFDASLFIFDPQNDIPIKNFANISKSPIIDACFMRNGKDLDIFLLNEEHKLFKICKEEKLVNFDDVMPSQSPSIKDNYSLFDGLLEGPKFDTSQNQLNLHPFKKIDMSLIENPPHILPPPKLFCWSIISKLLKDTKNSNKEISKIRSEDNEMELDTPLHKEIETPPEKNLDNRLSATNSNVPNSDFAWLESFFRSKEYSIAFD